MSENVTAYAPYDSEGNRLPLACPVEYLYDENGYDVLKRRGRYSTEEIKTGETWIDGRPIYRKVIEIAQFPNATTISIPHEIISAGFIAVDPGRSYAQESNSVGAGISIPFVYSGGAVVSAFADRTNLHIYTSTDRRAYKGWMTLNYTKTTDTPEVTSNG